MSKKPTEAILPHGAKSRTDDIVEPSELFEQKFINLIERRESLLLSNIIIDYGIKKLRLSASVKAITVVTLILTILLFFLTTIVSLIFSRSLPTFKFALLASFITAFSFGIIKYLDFSILSTSSKNFPKNLGSFVSDDEGLTALTHWLRSFLSLKKQLIVSIAFGLLGISCIFYVAKTRSLDFKAGSYILMFLCFFAIGFGAYCAVLIPTLTKVLSQKRMKMFWLNPADSPWINDASTFFTKLSMADALIAAFCITGLYLLRPWESPGTAWMAGSWLAIGIIVLSYTFLYPHYYLNRSIREEKSRQMEKIQAVIISYQARVNDLTKSEFKDLFERIKLYNHLATAKESAIDMQNSFRYITSLLVLILTYLGPLFSKLLGLTEP